MTGTRTGPSKSDRALELFEKGMDMPTIALRLNIAPSAVWTHLRNARAKREREIERAGKLADLMGHNI